MNLAAVATHIAAVHGGQGSRASTRVLDSLWWAVVTATTVGYGDHSPLGVEARGVAVVLMLVGIGMLSVVTANVAAFFLESDDADSQHELIERLDRIETMLAELTNPDTSHPAAALEER